MFKRSCDHKLFITPGSLSPILPVPSLSLLFRSLQIGIVIGMTIGQGGCQRITIVILFSLTVFKLTKVSALSKRLIPPQPTKGCRRQHAGFVHRLRGQTG